ncbi:hypothetical protein SELMODRAFT_76818 [Selaginella moellendorffii]|uniref:Pentacotripeptide-repeat region of PRORP domain-containing protein n=1 Tax=Selaginella moellendorffii TaxID=88036 RepID=D8QTV0_SELML|nr:hypothetical protein SELMODRAFT_76818 [Selaginella moellendorffii]
MNVVLFTTVIHWYSRADDIDRAVEMWNQMLKVGCLPNVVTYTMLMSLLTKLKRFRQVGEIFKDMVSGGCRPNVRTYTVLIQCLASSGNLDAALLSLGREGKIDAAEHLLEKMPLNGCKPNVVNYTSLINSLIHYGRVSHALAVFKRMQDEGVMPNSITYSLMSKGLKRANMLHDLVEVEKKMATIDFWKQQRVKSEDETLVNETILKALLPELKRESQDQRQTE